MLFAQRDYHRDQYMTGDLAEKQATSRDRTTSTTTKGRLPTRRLSADITHLLSSVLSRTEPRTTFSICLARTGSWAYCRPRRTQYRACDFVPSTSTPTSPYKSRLSTLPTARAKKDRSKMSWVVYSPALKRICEAGTEKRKPVGYAILHTKPCPQCDKIGTLRAGIAYKKDIQSRFYYYVSLCDII